MHDIRRLGLQVFAAPDNLTGEVQVQVKAREIDFVTSFGKNLKALLDILGITRMIRKENNSVLKTKTVKGELQSGDVGEGEEIPMSRYTVEEKPFDTIKIEKYRKGVSLEAILDKGYEAAVQDTDDLIASVVVDQEPNALVDLLDLANKGENPRVTKAMLDSYIDSEEVDIDELMEKTKDFLSKANATKKAVKEILKEYEEQMAKKKAQEL